jgi:dienelactone hydrolase
MNRALPNQDNAAPSRSVRVRAGGASLDGDLNREGLATLLLDLLTPKEEMADAQTGELRFDIGLLAERLAGATDWVGRQPQTSGLPVGFFGASTGAAAALVAAAQRPDRVSAVVSRGGRTDLAGGALEAV